MALADVLGTSVAAARFYRTLIELLQAKQVQFLLGGAYALVRYAPIRRRTKDLDLFVRQSDCARVLKAADQAGFRTELTDKQWLAKVFSDQYFTDIIFSSRNGIATVDDAWFEHAVTSNVFGVELSLCPPEEVLWSKSYVMERDRFDGADIAKLIYTRGSRMDWDRLQWRFSDTWQILLAHVTLYDFIYPGAPEAIPTWIRDWLLSQAFRQSEKGHDTSECRGHLLAQSQYPTDAPAEKSGEIRRRKPAA
jgi:hypothetical protein